MTTAAVMNFSFLPPKDPVDPTDLTANLKTSPKPQPTKTAPKITEDELIDWQTRVANLAAEMKAGGGPMLDEIRSKS